MVNKEILLETYKRQLTKALQHLHYSYNKISTMPEPINLQDEETLETWESFVARFARVIDIFLTKYLKTTILINDPGFSGTLRDFVNQGEKLEILNDAENWMQLRELRNISAHEYSEEDLEAFLARIKHECPKLLAIKIQ